MKEIPNTLINLVRFRVGDTNNTKIFDIKSIKYALELSLKAFNMSPVITYFKWDDVETIDMISDILVTYAVFTLWQSASFSERSQEVKVKDSGVTFTPPNLTEVALTLSTQAYDHWFNQVRSLKSSDSFYNDFVQDPISDKG